MQQQHLAKSRLFIYPAVTQLAIYGLTKKCGRINVNKVCLFTSEFNHMCELNRFYQYKMLNIHFHINYRHSMLFC